MAWWRRIAAALAALVLAAALGTEARADRLELSGRMTDDQGRPMAGEIFRLVLGSDAAPRDPGSGRRLTTDAQGRFRLLADVVLRPRRIRQDRLFGRQDSRLLEFGLEFDLLGRPALYWVEVDFTRAGALRGIAAFVAGPDGRFDVPLTFHRGEQAWSLPGDPRNLRLTSIGADVTIESENAGEGGVWRLSVAVRRQSFAMR